METSLSITAHALERFRERIDPASDWDAVQAAGDRALSIPRRYLPWLKLDRHPLAHRDGSFVLFDPDTSCILVCRAESVCTVLKATPGQATLCCRVGSL